MKVVLGFSGGVDSAVSAVLLKKAGFEVHGLYLDNTTEQARLEAVSSAGRMGVDLTVLDVHEALEARVCGPFAASYLRGETPNPCIRCRRPTGSARSSSPRGITPGRRAARSIRACPPMTRATCSAA